MLCAAYQFKFSVIASTSDGRLYRSPPRRLSYTNLYRPRPFWSRDGRTSLGLAIGIRVRANRKTGSGFFGAHFQGRMPPSFLRRIFFCYCVSKKAERGRGELPRTEQFN